MDTVPLDVATESYWGILDRRQETTWSEMGHGNGFATQRFWNHKTVLAERHWNETHKVIENKGGHFTAGEKTRMK